MNRVAEGCLRGDLLAGLDAVIVNVQNPGTWEHAFDADIHVAHTWFPETYNGKRLDRMLTKPLNLVYVAHGTPEFIFESSVDEGLFAGYGHGDPWMVFQHALQSADAVVTFWPRHAALYKTMLDKRSILATVPMGIDTDFWCPGETKGKYVGTPSVFFCESPHKIKWPYDILTAWPLIYPETDGACLHIKGMSVALNRWMFPLVNRNGSSYAAHISNLVDAPEGLRNTFRSVDYQIGPVRYGDFNRVSLEANAAGTKTISYAGNPYSDYWLSSHDQRVIATEMLSIFRGDIAPREKTEVPSLSDMATALHTVYERLL